MALSKLFLTPEKDLEDKKDLRCAARILLEHEFLAVLADHVRFPALVQRFGNEAVSLPLCASHRRSAGFQRPAFHQIQPVREHDPAVGKIS